MAPGGAGMALAGLDAALWPFAFSARTSKVYCLPLVRPETV